MSRINSTASGTLWTSVASNLSTLSNKTSFIQVLEGVNKLGNLAILKGNVFINDHLYLNEIDKEVRGPYDSIDAASVSAHTIITDNATVLPYGAFARLDQVLQKLDNYEFASYVSTTDMLAYVLPIISKCSCCLSASDVVTNHVFMRDCYGLIYRAEIGDDNTIGEFKLFYIPHYNWSKNDFEGANKIINLSHEHPIIAAILAKRIIASRLLTDVHVPHYLVTLNGASYKVEAIDEIARTCGLLNNRTYMKSLSMPYIVDFTDFKGTSRTAGTTAQCGCVNNDMLFANCKALTSITLGPQALLTGVTNAFADSLLTDITFADNGMFFYSKPEVASEGGEGEEGTSGFYTAPIAMYPLSTIGEWNVNIHVPYYTTIAAGDVAGFVNEADEPKVITVHTNIKPSDLSTGSAEAGYTGGFAYPTASSAKYIAPTNVYVRLFGKTLIPVPSE